MRHKAVLIAAAALLALVGGAALTWRIAGADWLFPVVAERVAAATGLQIAADGPLRATLLPYPGLRAAGIRIADRNRTPLFRADDLEFDIAWSSLFRGDTMPVQARLLRTRPLTEPPLPPLNLGLEAVNSGYELTMDAEVGSLVASIQRQGSEILLPSLRVQAGPWRATGSGRLTVGSPDARVVATLDTVEHAEQLIGTMAFAIGYGPDGLVLERGTWRSPHGAEAEVFGHAAADGGVIRVEGGLEGYVPSAGGADLNARFDGSVGANGVALALSDIDVRGRGSHLTGSAKYASAAPRRLSADLRLDRLDLGVLKDLAGGVGAIALSLPEADLDLKLRIGDVVAGPLTADGVILDIGRQQNVIELRELAARSLGGMPLHASGRIAAIDGKSATFAPFSIRYGQLDATGRVQVDLGGARSRIIADLTAAPLALDRWIAGPPPLPPEPMTRRAQAVAVAAAARRAATPQPWSVEPLPALPPLGADVDLTLASPRVTWAHHQVDAAGLIAHLRGTHLDVESLTGAIYGGRFELRGGADLAEQAQWKGTLALADADLKALLADLAHVDALRGHGDLTADLQASGTTPAALIASLAGTVRINARDGVIAGFDLPAVSDRIARAHRPTDLFEIARAGGGGQTPFSALTGQFKLARGVARTDDLHLLARKGEARLRGAIDLPRWTLDLVNELRVTEPADVPPLVLKLDGPIAAPRQVFDINRLQAYLVKRGAPVKAR